VGVALSVGAEIAIDTGLSNFHSDFADLPIFPCEVAFKGRNDYGKHRSSFSYASKRGACCSGFRIGAYRKCRNDAKDAGKEIMPGVRQVDLGKWPAQLPTYKSIVITDYVVAPGSGFPPEKMKNDMICHILEGEFRIKKDKEFTVKAGDVFACIIGESEEDTNPGQVDAVMRVIDLMAS
jgi:hypothetical protein